MQVVFAFVTCNFTDLFRISIWFGTLHPLDGKLFSRERQSVTAMEILVGLSRVFDI